MVGTSKIVGAHHEENYLKTSQNSLHNDVAGNTKPKKAFSKRFQKVANFFKKIFNGIFY